MKVAQIRAAFLDYFKKHEHRVMASASLIPKEDPSLLFVNAGMVPFKPYFLGLEEPKFTQLVSSQHCLRVGGKHNDLDNVGKTSRHHTFFEMLGNFSFGAYDKSTAIRFSWEFLVKVLRLPVNSLWVTVHHSDAAAKKIWIDEIGVLPDRVIACGDEDNFWSMGDTGPCGPCTEIFYDHGPSVAGGPPGSEDADGDRYVEIWNIVFMEYDRSQAGEMSPLPKACVDTGMGLERIAAVLQKVHSNYEIDVFQGLITAYHKIAGQEVSQIASQVIADHMRSICWLIHDGVLPSNEGRGYVLRRIIRRALRYAYVEQVALPCLYKLVPTVMQQFAHDKQFLQSESKITKALSAEEEAFSRTIANGLKLFDKYTSGLKGTVIPGDLVFKLYDTYGFPVDLVGDLAAEQGLTVDHEGFSQCMHVQKSRSRENQQFADAKTLDWVPQTRTEFVGYTQENCQGTLLSIHTQGVDSPSLASGPAQLVFNRSPFYAESGGQIGDRGVIRSVNGVFRVEDTQKYGQCIVHLGYLESGEILVDEVYEMQVDTSRHYIKKNHSATHLLHDALFDVLGEHVMQKGSLVASDRLRFDFAHSSPLTLEQIDKIESHVNLAIGQNFVVKTDVMRLDEAKSLGVKAQFDEKYEESVRVLSMGKSRELCGGTHVCRTGDIGLFMIVDQTSVAQGIRRIEAVTSKYALKYVQDHRQQLHSLSKVCQSPIDLMANKMIKITDLVKAQQKTIDQLNAAQLRYSSNEYLSTAEKVGDIRVLFTAVAFDQVKLMRVLTQLCLASGKVDVVILLLNHTDKIMLSVGVVDAMVEKVTAIELFKAMAKETGARGGGKPDFAQGSAILDESQDIDGVSTICKRSAWDFLQQ